MSLVVNSLGGGNTVSTSGTAASTGGVTAAIPFAQTLVQTMGGSTTKGTETPILGNLASLLQGLLNAVQSTGDEAGKTDSAKSTELLKGITLDVEKLDESIGNDPALLASLQGWLLQVSALLSGSAPNAEAGGTDAAVGLSPLAQNPETLRFAVQDELNGLVSLIQKAAAGGDEAKASQGIALLNDFTAILAETAPPESKPNSKGTGSNADTTAISLKQPAGTENKTDVKVKVLPIQGNRIAETTQANPEAVTTSSSVKTQTGEVINAPVTKAAASAESKNSGLADEPIPEVKTVTEDHEVVTVGQLSLRNGITAPLKTETTQVPVHQFAQEMSTFITGKLEIVKKGGVAEATITLFPENLGQVDVKITMQNGHLVAQFLTEHAGAKDMLEQQMNQLRSALQSQGLQVEKLEVSQNNTSLQSQYNGQQGRQSGSGGQQQGRRSKERDGEISDAVLAAELNGEWKDWVANARQENREQGGSFSAKA